MARRLPAMTTMRLLAVVALLALCCCRLVHASGATSTAAETSFPPVGTGLKGKQKQDGTRAGAPASSSSFGADEQAVLPGEAEAAAGRRRRVDLELQDYPGSGANDRHSPWGQERRN